MVVTWNCIALGKQQLFFDPPLHCIPAAAYPLLHTRLCTGFLFIIHAIHALLTSSTDAPAKIVNGILL